MVIVSQPFAKLPSQFPNPALHTMLHDPPLHEAAPFVDAQTVPHVPQFERLFDRLVSQPLATLLSQFPNPALQLIPQLPELQLAVPLAVLQAFVQLPQRVTSVFKLRSQPLVTLPSQLPNPALQVI